MSSDDQKTDPTATLAIKDQRTGAERNEFEYAIPLADAHELLAHHCDSTVAKIRHHIQHKDLTWVVDEYHDQHFEKACPAIFAMDAWCFSYAVQARGASVGAPTCG